MHNVEHISIYIHRAPDDVYAFASDPKNLPRWAAGIQFPEDENGEPVPFSWSPNLDVVDRLIACFGRPYKEAYGNCRE
jgi:hypothetical protein